MSILEKMKKEKKKLKILAAGDFHSDSKTARKLAIRAKKEKVDIVILLGDIVGTIYSKDLIMPFIKRKQKVLFVPGNWESSETVRNFKEKYGIKNIEDHYLKYKNVGIFGIGNSDWNLYPDDNKVFRKLSEDFERIKSLEKKILVSHMHAAGTKSELSGFAGSKGLRKAIDKFKPDLFIAGHIHELEGASEMIGKTKVVNVGRNGKILYI